MHEGFGNILYRAPARMDRHDQQNIVVKLQHNFDTRMLALVEILFHFVEDSDLRLI